MKKIFMVLCLLIITNGFTAEIKKGFLNIVSNVEDTTIFLNGKKIGKTPIKLYEVVPNKPIFMQAIVDTNYYERNIKASIKVHSNSIPTYTLKFKKAKTKLFFVGEDAELYINGSFIKKLHDSNRVVTVEAAKDVKIRLVQNDSEIIINKDVKVNDLNVLKYGMITTPKDVKLYTTTIDNLMWEDTKEAANTPINWEKAELYCKNMKVAHYDDFRLPTEDELDTLYEVKDKIYNGYGGKFYWSSTTFSDDKKVWNYSMVKNFEDGKNQKSIKEFEQARVRCVRDIIIEEEEDGNK